MTDTLEAKFIATHWSILLKELSRVQSVSDKQTMCNIYLEHLKPFFKIDVISNPIAGPVIIAMKQLIVLIETYKDTLPTDTPTS